MKKVLYGIIILTFVIIGFIYFLYDPSTFSFFPLCPLHSITGFLCPGCGTQQAIHDLTHLRIGQAFHHNAFLVLSIPYVILGYYLEWKKEKTRFEKKIKSTLYGYYAIVLILIIFIVFWIGRNMM